MQVIATINELKQVLLAQRRQGNSIGLVPTMGALHDGHISLVTAAVEENDFTVVSIFVNPTQFNNQDDFVKYPKSEAADINIVSEAGANIIFMPSKEEMYDEGELLRMDFKPLSDRLEGAFRPGHFAGVGLVVAKLFSIVTPDSAYFGQKDLQQCMIVSQLNQSLRFGINIRMMPIIRDQNGLALSSRNRHLGSADTLLAAEISTILFAACEEVLHDHSIGEATSNAKNRFKKLKNIELEYFEIVSQQTFLPPKKSDKMLAICVAAYVNGIRLIDNTLLTLP